MPNGERAALHFYKCGKEYFWILEPPFDKRKKLARYCGGLENGLSRRDVKKLTKYEIRFKDGDVCKYDVVILHDWELSDDYTVTKRMKIVDEKLER